MYPHEATQRGAAQAAQRLGLSHVTSAGLNQSLEKKANWRRLAVGLPADIPYTEYPKLVMQASPERTARLNLTRPGDIGVHLGPTRVDIAHTLRGLSDAQRANPRIVSREIVKSLAGEGATHSFIVQHPDRNAAVGFPFGTEAILGIQPTLVMRPKGTTPEQGQAAAKAMAMADVQNKYYSPALYEYEHPVGMQSETRNPLVYNRFGQMAEEALSGIPGLRSRAPQAAADARAAALSVPGRGVCDPQTEVCSTAVGRAWEDKKALGAAARPFLIGAPELDPGQAKMFSSPSALVRSPNMELITSNFDIDRMLAGLPSGLNAKEIYDILPIRDLTRGVLTSDELADAIETRLGRRMGAGFKALRSRIFK